MAISKKTLLSIQRTADLSSKATGALQEATRKISESLSKALADNPFGFGGISHSDLSVGTDMGDLTQRMQAVTAEVSVIYRAAVAIAEKCKGSQALLSLGMNSGRGATLALANVKGRMPKPGSNAVKVLAELSKTLTQDNFTKLNQSNLSKDLAIPLGSMTSALRRLTQIGAIVGDENGAYKLGSGIVASHIIEANKTEPTKSGKLASRSTKAGARTKGKNKLAMKVTSIKKSGKRKPVAVTPTISSKIDEDAVDVAKVSVEQAGAVQDIQQDALSVTTEKSAVTVVDHALSEQG